MRNETIGLKIRDHAMQRVPYQLIVGGREQEEHTVAVRAREGKDLGAMSVDDFILRLERDSARLGRTDSED